MTIDPDVEALLRQRMRVRGETFKAALNGALRVGLMPEAVVEARPFQQRTFRMGFRPEVDLDKALALADSLADVGFAFPG